LRTVGQEFLETLAGFPPNSFENAFYSDSRRLDLGSIFDRNELSLLYETSFCGYWCNRLINGVDCCGAPPQKLEANRRKLECDFMAARDIFFASPGWQNLCLVNQEAIQHTFLQVFVSDEKLAW